MSGRASSKKGRALEKAVGAIEKVVFGNQPELVGRNVTIRANHRMCDHGVNHEVDVIVYVDEGTPHQAIHAYECKNTKVSTDKDVVIVFKHKLKVLGAVTGTIVAQKFTSGARAQAALFENVRLFTFTQDFWTGVENLQWVATSYDVGIAQATVHFISNEPGNQVVEIDCPCVLDSQPTTLLKIVQEIIDEHFIAVRQKNELAQLEGLHGRHTSARRDYAYGRLLVDGRRAGAITLEIPYLLSVRHSRLVAKFNIHNRGGHYDFVCEKDPFEGKVFSVEVTTKPV